MIGTVAGEQRAGPVSRKTSLPSAEFSPALALIEQQDCWMLDWTSAANGALLVRPEASSPEVFNFFDGIERAPD